MNHLITHAKLLFVAGAWGGAWTSGRIVATHIPPVLGATLRYAMAVPMFLLILRWLEPSDEGRWGIRSPSRGEWRRLMMIGIFSTFLYQVLFMLGMQRTAVRGCIPGHLIQSGLHSDPRRTLPRRAIHCSNGGRLGPWCGRCRP